MQQNNDKSLCIIDGYGLFFMSYYALKSSNMLTPEGQPIGAILGMMRMLVSLINKIKPKYLIITLDSGSRTFRDEIYDNFLEKKFIQEMYQSYKEKFLESDIELNMLLDTNLTCKNLIKLLNLNLESIEVLNLLLRLNIAKETLENNKILLIIYFLNIQDNFIIDKYQSKYKANRKKTPDDLVSQFAIMHEMLDSFAIKRTQVKNYEADDIIASLIKNFSNNNVYQNNINKITIISSDKDLMQLIKDKNEKNNICVGMYHPMKKRYFDENEVYKEFGVKAENISDYLSLTGDASDNIPGVPQIGPKTAIDLINKFDNINNLLKLLNDSKNTLDINDKVHSHIVNNKDLLTLSRQLVKLEDNLLINYTLNDLEFKPNFETLKTFTQKYSIEKIGISNSGNLFFTKNNSFNNGIKNNINENNNNNNIQYNGNVDNDSFQNTAITDSDFVENSAIFNDSSDKVNIKNDIQNFDNISNKNNNNTIQDDKIFIQKSLFENF